MSKIRAEFVADRAAAPEHSRLAAVWLFAVASLVMAMVMVGGATRLTGSGLSITEWKPLLGAMPPLSDSAWAEAYRRYQATTQYRLENQGMTLAQFKPIFWWEWSHRLLGRVVGVVFTIPLVALVATRRIPHRLVPACAVLLVLGAVQGFVGWWMVKSGLEGRVSVAPERLATHLGVALILLSALIWTGLEAWAGPPKNAGGRARGWLVACGLFAGLAYFQCLLGALVAGNQAGLLNSDWPMMSGHWFPTDYWQGAFWASVAHGSAAVQFDHRIVAYGLAVFALALAWTAWRSRIVDPILRRLCVALLLVVGAQVALGVAVLLTVVSPPIALLHQLTAAALLSLSISLAWRSARA